MTERVGGGSDGISDLPFTSAGDNFIFEWDVGLDLPNVEDTSVYVRLESNDSVTNSNIAVSSAFVVNTAGPVISNITASQTAGTDNVAITYDLADGAGANNTVVLSVSDDSGAAYNVLSPSKTGDVDADVTAGLARSIVWNVGADLAGQENSAMKVKIVATDSYGNEGTPAESADFAIDTKAPIVSDVTASQVSGSALVTVNYNLADLNSSNVEFSVSADSGSTWTIATTTFTGNVGAGQTAGAKTFNWNAVVDLPDQELDTMRVRVRALDIYGHQSAFVESADFSVNTKVLSISNITAAQIVGANTVSIRYDLNKTATTSLEISSDGGATWNVTTTTLTGQINTSVTAGNNKTINWNPAIDFNNEENNSMRVRLRGVDLLGITSAYYESANFSVDTAAPLGLLSLSKFSGTNDSVTMNWSAGITDANFSHYELWHGVNQNDVVNRNGAAQVWNVANDSNLSSLTAVSTVITGIDLSSDYFVKIWAVDNYNNEATITGLNVFSAPTSTPAPPAAENISSAGVSSDVTAPIKPILSPLQTPTNNTSVTISGLAEPFARVNLYDNGVFVGSSDNSADEGGKFSQVFILLEGEHVLTIKAVDSAVNVSEPSDPVNVKIITTAPSAPIILSPQNNSQVIDETPTLIGVTDPFAQIEIIFDDKKQFITNADSDGAWQFKLPSDFALQNGSHKFMLRATDVAGNESAETILLINKVALPVEIKAEPVAVAPVAVIPAPSAKITEIILPPPPAPLPPAELVRESGGIAGHPGSASVQC